MKDRYNSERERRYECYMSAILDAPGDYQSGFALCSDSQHHDQYEAQEMK